MGRMRGKINKKMRLRDFFRKKNKEIKINEIYYIISSLKWHVDIQDISEVIMNSIVSDSLDYETVELLFGYEDEQKIYEEIIKHTFNDFTTQDIEKYFKENETEALNFFSLFKNNLGFKEVSDFTCLEFIFVQKCLQLESTGEAGKSNKKESLIGGVRI
ncbi:MAG: hypothetical protein LBC39_02695 [Methanobrevibacter sp.]|jgi:hypothetical protein|nr:hypothetical protein [Candidatus Methanovirga aequatorialis]